MRPITITRQQLVRQRFERHDLHRAPASLPKATDVALLDYGVQDTGPDGAAWALAVRGAPVPGTDELAFAWTLRGAPHAYRRADLEAVAVATAPLSEADAAKRIFDAAKPLKAAGISILDALTTVADRERAIVVDPTVKGDLSSRLNEVLAEPFQRECRPCRAIHIYEMPIRLAALQAGLELEAGTSPPVLRRVPGLEPTRFQRLGTEADPRMDVIRNHLRFYPGARLRDAAVFVDAPLKEIKANWPHDAVEVTISEAEPSARHEPRFVLAGDAEGLTEPPRRGPGALRLLGPYDPYLQLRDRSSSSPTKRGARICGGCWAAPAPS